MTDGLDIEVRKEKSGLHFCSTSVLSGTLVRRILKLSAPGLEPGKKKRSCWSPASGHVHHGRWVPRKTLEEWSNSSIAGGHHHERIYIEESQVESLMENADFEIPRHKTF